MTGNFYCRPWVCSLGVTLFCCLVLNLQETSEARGYQHVFSDKEVSEDSRLAALESKFAALEKTVEEFRVENEILRTENSEVKASMSLFQTVVDALTGRLSVLEGQKADLEERVTVLEAVARKNLPQTCRHFADMGVTKSGKYMIDPDGPGIGEAPISVYCDFENDGATIVTHDTMETVVIDHCAEPGCFKKEIKYDSTTRQMNALIDLSTACTQDITYGCFIAPLTGSNDVEYAWWEDKNGKKNYYWSGPQTDEHVCACGLTDSCQSQPDMVCNCDASAPAFFTDEGTLTDSSSLPVKALHFGGLTYDTQQANFTLGGLKCTGRKTFDPSQSCDSLRKAGHLDSGLFVVKPASNYYQVTKCNMDLETSDPNFQVDTGAKIPDGAVMFGAYRTSKIELSGTDIVIPYEAFVVSVGGGMDLSKGVFTAPRDGYYFFSFKGRDSSETAYALVNLRKNGSIITTGYSLAKDDNVIAMSAIVQLKKGDKVDVTLVGPLYSDTTNRYIHFTGHLLAPLA